MGLARYIRVKPKLFVQISRGRAFVEQTAAHCSASVSLATSPTPQAGGMRYVISTN